MYVFTTKLKINSSIIIVALLPFFIFTCCTTVYAQNATPSGSLTTQSQKDPGANEALMKAIAAGDLEAVKKSVEKGADVNADFIQAGLGVIGSNNFKPVMKAASLGKAEILSYLIEKGADAGSKDSKGYSAWEYAAAGCHKAVLEILKAKKIEPAENSQKAIEELQLIKCKSEMDKILITLEMYDMDIGVKPTTTVGDLVKGKYLKQAGRCPLCPDTDYTIIINANGKPRYDVKCQKHGSMNELGGYNKK